MCVCVCVCVCVIKIIGKVDKSNTYNRFSRNISFFILRRTSSEKKYFEFFSVSAIEEIDKIMVKM